MQNKESSVMKKISKRFRIVSLVLAFALIAGLFAPMNVTKAEAKTIKRTLYAAVGETVNVSTFNTTSVKSSRPGYVSAAKSGAYKVVVKAKKVGSSVVTIKDKYNTYQFTMYVEKKAYTKSSGVVSSSVKTSSGSTRTSRYGKINIKNTSKHLYYSSVKVTYQYTLSNGRVNTSYTYIHDLKSGQSGSDMVYLTSSTGVKSFKVTGVAITTGSCCYTHTNQNSKVTVTAPKKSGSYVKFTIANKSGKNVDGVVDFAEYDAKGKMIDIYHYYVFLGKGEKETKSFYPDSDARSFKVLSKRIFTNNYISLY